MSKAKVVIDFYTGLDKSKPEGLEESMEKSSEKDMMQHINMATAPELTKERRQYLERMLKDEELTETVGITVINEGAFKIKQGDMFILTGHEGVIKYLNILFK